MKKFIIFILILLSFNFAYAAGTTSGEKTSSETSTTSGDKAKTEASSPAVGKLQVKVSEKIPGVNCVPTEGKSGPNGIQYYLCDVEPGFTSVQIMIGDIIKYFTALSALAGVLFIVINGIMLSMGGLDSSAKQNTKKNLSHALIGLVLLFLSGIILNIIAPWIYR